MDDIDFCTNFGPKMDDEKGILNLMFDYCVVIVLELIATTLPRDKTNHLVTFQTNKFQKFAIKNLLALF